MRISSPVTRSMLYEVLEEIDEEFGRSVNELVPTEKLWVCFRRVIFWYSCSWMLVARAQSHAIEDALVRMA